MLKVNTIWKSVKQCSCDNCNIEPEYVYKYSFSDKKGIEYNTFTLCSECSRKLSTLHGACPLLHDSGTAIE